MRNQTLLVIWFLLQACNNVGSVRNPYQPNLVADNQLSQLFVQGDHNATLTTYKVLSGEKKKVLKKSLQIITGNEELLSEFDALLKNPQLIDQNELRKKTGLSQREFDDLISIFINRETSTERGTISILNDDDRISFKGSGRFSILDSLVFHPKDSSATFKQSELDISQPDSSYRSNNYLPAGENLESVFSFKGPNSLIGLLEGYSCAVVAARLNKSGNTYLYLKSKERFDIERPFDQFYSIVID